MDVKKDGYAPAALLFAGQGTQLEGVGRPLLEAFPQAAARLQEFSAACGQDVQALLCGTVPAQDTRKVHLALMALTLLLREYAPQKNVLLAGHSYGDVLALVYAGALSVEDALHLAHVRGDALAQTCAEEEGGMLAAFGAPVQEMEHAVLRWRQDTGAEVWPVNYNTPEQLGIAGRAAALHTLAVVLQGRGCGVKRLPTEGAFHSPLMRPAAEQVFAAASQLAWRRPAVPVLSSMTARLLTGSHFAAHVALQMVSPVRWLNVLDALRRADVRQVREIGGGNVLCRFCAVMPEWTVDARPFTVPAAPSV